MRGAKDWAVCMRVNLEPNRKKDWPGWLPIPGEIFGGKASARRQTPFLWLAGLWLLAMAFPAYAQEQVIDGSFEKASAFPRDSGETRDLPGAWVAFLPKDALDVLRVVEGAGRLGGKAAFFAGGAPAKPSVHLDQVLRVEPGAYYRVRAWTRSDGTNDAVLAVLTLKWRAMAVMACGSNASWQETELYFNAGDETLVRLEWFPGARGTLYSGGGSGVGWLDEVRAEKIEPSAMPPVLLQSLTYKSVRHERIDPARIARQPIGSPLPLRPMRVADGILLYADGGEVSLFGVNFQTPLSWEYKGITAKRGIPLENAALHAIADASLDELVRMGATVLRAHLLPYDFTDPNGRLRETVYLDQLDYLLDQCGKRGIYLYLTLLNEMGKGSEGGSWMDGFPERAHWLLDPGCQEALRAYVTSLLTRVNPYNRKVYKDDPALAILELINEPNYVTRRDLETAPGLASAWAGVQKAARDSRAPIDSQFTVFRHDYVRAWIDELCGVIRAAGAKQPIVWNLNWPGYLGGKEEVFQAVAESRVDAVSFCAYPGQSECVNPYWKHPTNFSGRDFLPRLAGWFKDEGQLGWLLQKRFAAKAKLVYEFEAFYNQDAWIYPAMARLFRCLGAQAAPMWTYRMLPAALYQGGSHYLNLSTTPEKAMGFRVASEIMRAIPRYAPYEPDEKGELKADTWWISQPANNAVSCDGRTLVYARSIPSFPMPVPRTLRRVAGTGSSPLASYGGSGAYFIDIREGAVEIEIMPDVVYMRPPETRDNAEPICRLDSNATHPFSLFIDKIGNDRSLDRGILRRMPPGGGLIVKTRGPGITFDASAGRWLLSAK